MQPLVRHVLWAVLCLGLVFAPARLARGEETGEETQTRSSETTEGPTDWATRGFRLQLRIGWEALLAELPAPGLTAVGLVIEPGVRLSARWSVDLDLRYTVANGRWKGLRWSTTLDGTLHPTRSTQLTLGVGYGGLQLRKKLERADLLLSTWRKPRQDSKLITCEGDGAVALARVGYLFAVGELFSTGPAVQADLQATPCIGYTLNVRTASWIWAREWWWHKSVQVSWSLAWR